MTATPAHPVDCTCDESPWCSLEAVAIIDAAAEAKNAPNYANRRCIRCGELFQPIATHLDSDVVIGADRCRRAPDGGSHEALPSPRTGYSLHVAPCPLSEPYAPVDWPCRCRTSAP